MISDSRKLDQTCLQSTEQKHKGGNWNEVCICVPSFRRGSDDAGICRGVACSRAEAISGRKPDLQIESGVGLIVGSRQRMRCRFVSASDHRIERYSGTVTRLGLDLGITVGRVMRWSMLTRTRRVGRGVLAGHYVGASADASVGVGIGAKVLIGGSRRTTILQPLSVSGRVGVNLAARRYRPHPEV